MKDTQLFLFGATYYLQPLWKSTLSAFPPFFLFFFFSLNLHLSRYKDLVGMELPPVSTDRVTYPGNKTDIEDQEQPLEEESQSGDMDPLEDVITSRGLQERAGLQLDQVLKVQQLNEASDFTVTDLDKNVTTNTCQESTDMSTSSKDEMVLCSGQLIYSSNFSFLYLF